MGQKPVINIMYDAASPTSFLSRSFMKKVAFIFVGKDHYFYSYSIALRQ